LKQRRIGGLTAGQTRPHAADVKSVLLKATNCLFYKGLDAQQCFDRGLTHVL
jgi:hypothetical protein